MKRSGRTALALLALAIVLAVVLRPSGSAEPVYQGKKLSEWLHNIRSPVATEAIRNMGTNALPSLIRWISYEPPAWKRSLLLKIPNNRLRYRLERQETLSIYANGAFSILGPTAAPAIPNLVRIIDEPGRQRSRIAAIRALGYLGPPAFPHLLRVIEEWRKPGCFEAAGSILRLYHAGVDIAPAMPALLLLDRRTAMASELNPTVDYAYCSSLWERPTEFATLLTNCLQHSNCIVRLMATQRLEILGKDALCAVPSLTRALADPDDSVRAGARNALRQIAPNTLQGANQTTP